MPNSVATKALPTTTMQLRSITPIIIYKFILFTTFKEQLTFITILQNLPNATPFKAVALSCGLGNTLQ